MMDVLGLARLCIGGKLRRATGSPASCGAFDVARSMKEPCRTCTGLNYVMGLGDWFWIVKESGVYLSFIGSQEVVCLVRLYD
jgi:hypothetical protein